MYYTLALIYIYIWNVSILICETFFGVVGWELCREFFFSSQEMFFFRLYIWFVSVPHLQIHVLNKIIIKKIIDLFPIQYIM